MTGMLNDKNRCADHHQGLAAQPVGQQPRKQGGEDAAQQHGRDNDRELAGVQARGGFQVRQRATDDADIHPIQQPAQSRNQQKQAVIGAVGIYSSKGWHRGDQARRIELQTTRITGERKPTYPENSGSWTRTPAWVFGSGRVAHLRLANIARPARDSGLSPFRDDVTEAGAWFPSGPVWRPCRWRCRRP